MIYRQDFNRVWGDLVERGEIKSKGKSGEKVIEIGLENISGNPSYYAAELFQDGGSKRLDGEVVERFIDGTDFVIQLNEYRGCRPVSNKKTLSEGEMEAPKSGVENCLFGCNDSAKNLSLLVRNPSGQFVLRNWRYNLYYNAFPIEEGGHFMYVPVERHGIVERIPHVSQRLAKESVEDMLSLSSNSEDAILFFNSIHAGANVDHLHIQQVFYRRYLKDRNKNPLVNNRLAIENTPVEKYKGRNVLIEHPIRGLVFRAEDTPLVWGCIEKLQEKGVPFNWILIGEKSYLVPRKKEFEKVSEFPNILASLEIAGKLVVIDEKTFSKVSGVTKQDLFGAFGKMSYTIDELVKMFA